MKPRDVLREMFEAAVAASQADKVLAPYLPAPPKGRTVVVGAGKAAVAMAQALERLWPTELSGMVVTPYGHALPCKQIEVREAAHPVPDAASESAARAMLQQVQNLTADDLVIALISGGGSSLLSLPAEGLALADKQAINRALLASGASIQDINTVRKQLSAIKGGRLARACAPARICTLIISDVPGDEPADIASGPTIADHGSPAQALKILQRYDIDVPDSVARHLQAAKCAPPAENEPHGTVRLVATPQMALEAAAAVAERHGYRPLILSDRIEGEAREVARVHAAIAQQVRAHGQPLTAPCVVLSGGETTVTLKGKGRGGRNAEFALALALALDQAPGIYALAADTDGKDGSEENAGAFVDPQTLERAVAAGLSPRDELQRNNAYEVFAASGDLLITGPTHTNVNDFRAILVERSEA